LADKVVQIGVMDESILNATSFVMYWWIAVPQNLNISTNNTWKNNTKWTESNEFRFTNLKPFTLYNLTIFVRARGSDKVFPPYLFYEVVTNEVCEYANWSRESTVVTVLFLFYFSQIQPNPQRVIRSDK
jgi:hypothetical protein